MRKLLLVSFSLLLLSCEKEANRTASGSACYECDLKATFTRTYADVGCYSDDEWSRLNLTNENGSTINKNERCRKK